MRSNITVFICLCVGITLSSCEKLPEARPIPVSAFGLSPVYIDSAEARIIKTQQATPILDGRAFALLNDTLFIVDHLKGIHILNNSDPAAPVAISFISIPGCTSVAVSGNFLYVNNITDLVTLDITDPLNAVIVDREPNLYPSPLEYPEEYVGYYECFDPSRGFLSGWENTTIEFPECFVE